MTAKELKSGMTLQTERWGLCEVACTYLTDKGFIVVLRDAQGNLHGVEKFPGSVVTVIGEVEHQP